jgi:hypothetical protein
MPANRYELQNGTRVPGCTTIVGQLDKPALLDWVARVTKEGKDWREERDSAGDTGTQVHDLILNFLAGEEVAIPDNDTVTNCFKKFLKWWGKEANGVEIVSEQPFVSEKLRFGGQPDLFIITKGKLIDFKTGSGIYDSFWIQLAGYDILLREHGFKPKQYQIVWIPKDNRFDAPIRKDLRNEKKIFRALLDIYYLRKNGH